MFDLSYEITFIKYFNQFDQITPNMTFTQFNSLTINLKKSFNGFEKKRSPQQKIKNDT